MQELTAGFEGWLETAGDFEDLLEVYRWLLERLKDSEPVQAGRALVDIELMLAAIRELGRRSDHPLSPFVTPSGWRREVGQYSERLPRLESRLHQYIRTQCEVKREDVDYLRPIRHFLSDEMQLNIFTLNYDYTVELVCQELNIPYTDGFATYWRPEEFENSSAQVLLHKMHGSILWYQTSRPPLKLVKIPISDADPENIKFFSDDAVSTSVIYPALVKEQHVEPYATLVSNFRRALQEIDVLVVIGYSFRDQYLKDLVLEKMHENLSLRLLFVAPDAETVLSESDRMLGGSWQFGDVRARIQTLPMTAGDCLRDGFAARRIRRQREARDLVTETNQLRLTQARTARLDAAVPAIQALYDANDLGGIVEVMRDDAEEIWHEAAGVFGAADPRGITARVISLVNASDGHAVKILDGLISAFLAIAKYSVIQGRDSTRAVGEGLSQIRIDLTKLDEWARERSRPARELSDALSEVADTLAWHSAAAAHILADLAEDYGAVADYFQSLEVGRRYKTWENQASRLGHSGAIAFPQSIDDAAIAELTARMTADARPRSLAEAGPLAD